MDSDSIAQCPVNFEAFQGSCYLLPNETKKWNDTMNTCFDQGADMVKVSSEKENEFIKRSGKNLWLGLRRDAVIHKTFKWNDGTTSDANFRKWAIDEPNNANDKEDCVQYLSNGVWNDISCEHLENIACEKGEFRKTDFKSVLLFLYSARSIRHKCQIMHAQFQSAWHEVVSQNQTSQDAFGVTNRG